MKKSFIILLILLLAAGFATLWVFIEDMILENSHPVKYGEYVEKYSSLYAVPEEIVYGVIKTESGFKSDAVSPKGAIGLMQITPDTFEWLRFKMGENDSSSTSDLLYNPEINIKYGTYFLSLLYTEFGIWDTAYAAYNAGRGKVNEWLKNPQNNDNGKLMNIPYKETSDYVKKVSRAVENYKKIYEK